MTTDLFVTRDKISGYSQTRIAVLHFCQVKIHLRGQKLILFVYIERHSIEYEPWAHEMPNSNSNYDWDEDENEHMQEA